MKQEQLVDGFSSEDEFRQEEIFVQDRPTAEAGHSHKEEVRYVVPPRPELKDKPYPLHPDISSGWVPRILLPNPVPLLY